MLAPRPRRAGRANAGDGGVGDAGPIYDSFVVKIWRDTGSTHLRRAEVFHVQTDLTDLARDVEPTWLLRTLLAQLGFADDVGADSPDDPTPRP